MDPGGICAVVLLVGAIPAAILIDRWWKGYKERSTREDTLWQQDWINRYNEAEDLYGQMAITSGEYYATIQQLKTEWEMRYGRNYGPLLGLIALDMFTE